MDLTHPTACLTHSLLRASRRLVRGFDAAAAETGVSAQQFSTLAMLSGHGEMSVGQIAQAVEADRTTLTRNLGLMARRGWIVEAAAKDRRERVWRLTDAGREVLGQVMPIWQDWQGRLVALLGPEEAARMLAVLETLEQT